jgi:GMP synthase-like glutamine amidotransferase
MSTIEEIPSPIERDNKREQAYKSELERKINAEELKFLESELQRTKLHHEKMKGIVDSLEILKKKPVLLINASDKGTMGQDWIADMDTELLKYFVKIQSGQDYEKENFNYKQFIPRVFEYMFGFEKDDDRFKKVSLVHGDKLPKYPSDYSLIIGTGGEINDFETQPQYLETKESLRDFFALSWNAKVPFAVTCATHQILGQLMYEKNGNVGSIVRNLKDKYGCPATESGIVKFTLNDAGKESFLTRGLDKEFFIMSNHGQYLQELPPGAESLAFNDVCSTQIIEYKDNGHTSGIGFQAHPEISNAILLLVQRYERAQVARKNGIINTSEIEVDTRPTYMVRENVFPRIFDLFLKKQ